MKLNEVQANASYVQRLRLTADNRYLFSVGRDGLICIFDVKAEGLRDYEVDLPFSNEILTERAQIEQILVERETCKQDLLSMKDESESRLSKDISVKREVEHIIRLKEEIETNKKQYGQS